MTYPINQMLTHVAFHPSLQANIELEMKAFESQAFNNKLIAIISMVAIATVTTAGIVFASIFMPYMIPFAIFAGGSLAEFVRKKYCAVFMARSQIALVNFVHSKEIFKRVQALRTSTPFNLEETLKNYAINPMEISHAASLFQLSPENIYKPLLNPIAKFQYWEERSKEIEKELITLNQSIDNLTERLNSPEIHPFDAYELKKLWHQSHIKKQELEEEHYLPTKLAAAFNLHVLAEPHDRRSAQDFGAPIANYQESASMITSCELPYFYFNPSRGYSPLSKKWLMDQPIQEIAKIIFGGNAITVSSAA